jgi:hypothetical protein
VVMSEIWRWQDALPSTGDDLLSEAVGRGT